MTRVIALDTSGDIASVALLNNGQLTSEESEGFSSHSLTIMPMIDRLLKQAQLTLSDLQVIAFSMGPGSFTGIRTSCGVAQGLALGANLPVVGVTTLQAMAHEVYRKTSHSNVLALIDARMHEVYWAQYAFKNNVWETVIEPTLSKASEISPIGEPVFCGNALKVYQEELTNSIKNAIVYPDIYPNAQAIAYLGETAYLRNEAKDVSAISPVYLRNKVALTTNERQKKQNL